MKKTIIIVSALAVLFSCTKENTGNNESYSEIEAEIVQTNETDVKVLIGEKDGNRYPLTWSEGDGIYAMTATPTSETIYFTSTVTPSSVGKQIGYFRIPTGEDVTTMIAVCGGTIYSSKTSWTSKTNFKVTSKVSGEQDDFTVPMYATYDNGSLKFHPAAAIIKFTNIPEGYTNVTVGAQSFRFSINNKGEFSTEAYTATPCKSNLNDNPYFAIMPGARNQFEITISNGSKSKEYTVAKRTFDAGKLYTLDCSKFMEIK